MWTLVISLVMAGLFLVAIYYITRRQTPPVMIREEYISPADFGIYNYLNVPVTVKVGATTLVAALGPNERYGLPKEQVIKYLTPTSIIEITLVTGRKYAEIVIDTERHERIKNLHIGMITSRFIGKTTDSLRMSTIAGNAVGGNAWLKIHNLTDIPLELNDDVVVAPHSEVKYLGYRNQGVTLGTYFKDPNGMYPEYQYLIPQSDLYYGVVSDLKQPVQGPFQTEFSDDCDSAQTLWPFEMGQM